MLRLWRALQQRLSTVCKVGTLCVLSTTADLKSYSSTCVAERAQKARRASAESLLDVLSMDDAGAVAL